MASHKYLIIGGGMTADAAVSGIREVDPGGSIGLISAEPHLPYNRPPLSKGLWKGQPTDSIWRKAAKAEAATYLGRTVRQVDLAAKRVSDDQGTTYGFEKLLLATGGTPRQLPGSPDGVIYYRTLNDFHRLRDAAERASEVIVIGGGFIGSEIAAALAVNNKSVTMILPEEGVGGRVFPRDLSLFLNEYYRQHGVKLQPGQRVASVERLDGGYDVKTADGRSFHGEIVVAGLGITPNVELARAAGLHVDSGIDVDAGLRTSHPDVYAAGDVAAFFAPALGRRVRVEHEDNALTMGKLAGRAMAGDSVNYDYLPYFYSDLFDLGYEAVGQTDSRLEVFADWKEPNREGVIYYLSDGRVRGVVLWNVWDQVKAARELIASPGPYRAEELRGRLPR